MIIPIRCFNCGNILASKYKQYISLINAPILVKIYEKNGPVLYLPEQLEKGSWTQEEEITLHDRNNIVQNVLTHIDNEHLQLSDSNNERIGTDVIDSKEYIESIILDQLGLKHYCCRTFVMSHIPLLEKF